MELIGQNCTEQVKDKTLFVLFILLSYLFIIIFLFLFVYNIA